ncbi:porin family protein [Flavobacterium glaciei]|uniref:Outer membrane protein X n=1 Tax=Flavobacterium glaciei TaxID=386300 RepID=A0A562Q5D9_9FLAO|nr:OmpW family outer membrane protein [Flavobacterium glaciei]RDI58188.1 outer membrane protein X [Flavobacterium glaciei]TWI51975.1 outer membrane protein X [Flavobacterium glaciei]
MKKIILSVLITLSCIGGYAQKEGGFRVGLDLGIVPANSGGGVLLSLEPKYNIKDNMNVGLRIGVAAIVRDINDSGANTSAKVAANGSYVATYDYYFNASGKSFVPYVGAGAGYYTIANVEFNDSSTSNNNDVNVEATGKFGGLLRGGFEWGKFRMGLEYNLVPESTLQDTNGNNQGSVANSYVGIHLGFYVGGGKWRR